MQHTRQEHIEILEFDMSHALHGAFISGVQAVSDAILSGKSMEEVRQISNSHFENYTNAQGIAKRIEILGLPIRTAVVSLRPEWYTKTFKDFENEVNEKVCASSHNANAVATIAQFIP